MQNKNKTNIKVEENKDNFIGNLQKQTYTTEEITKDDIKQIETSPKKEHPEMENKTVCKVVEEI